MNSVLTKFPDGDHLPTVQGQMACSKSVAKATVEWQFFSVPDTMLID